MRNTKVLVPEKYPCIYLAYPAVIVLLPASHGVNHITFFFSILGSRLQLNSFSVFIRPCIKEWSGICCHTSYNKIPFSLLKINGLPSVLSFLVFSVPQVFLTSSLKNTHIFCLLISRKHLQHEIQQMLYVLTVNKLASSKSKWQWINLNIE